MCQYGVRFARSMSQSTGRKSASAMSTSSHTVVNNTAVSNTDMFHLSFLLHVVHQQVLDFAFRFDARQNHFIYCTTCYQIVDEDCAVVARLFLPHRADTLDDLLALFEIPPMPEVDKDAAAVL